MPLPTPGGKVPEFDMQAAVTGRAISPAALAGRNVVLIFHGPRSTEVPKEVNKAVRAKYLDAGEVFVTNIVDLHSMSGLWRKVAEATIKQSYDKMAAKVHERNEDADPTEYVAICADWDNSVAPRFGVTDSDASPTVVVIGKTGKVVGSAQGGDLAGQTMALLASI